MLEALIEPIIKALLQKGFEFYKEQKAENAIRKAEAYERALAAWEDVTRIHTEYVPVPLFRVVQPGPGGGEVPRGPGSGTAPPA